METKLIDGLWNSSCFFKAALIALRRLIKKELIRKFYAFSPLAASQKKVQIWVSAQTYSCWNKAKYSSPRANHLPPAAPHLNCPTLAFRNITPKPVPTIKPYGIALLAFHTYVVSRKDPSLHLSRAFLAAGFPENSTMPFPEDRPLSSTITTALSTWPNTEKASSRSSLDTNWGRFLTVSDALWHAKRTLSCFPRRGMLSSSTFAISARVRVSWRHKELLLKLSMQYRISQSLSQQSRAYFPWTSTSERKK